MADTKDISNNPNVEDKKKILRAESLYNEDEKKYLDHLESRFNSAKNQRNTTHKEFDNMTFTQYFDSNEEIANTYIESPKDDDDIAVSAGTVESKLDQILSNINQLNLKNNLFVFDKYDNEIQDLKIALEDIIDKTEKNEPSSDNSGDQEKRATRQRELLKQGTVFVQDEWKKVWKTKKNLDKTKYNGEFKVAADLWSEKVEKVYEGPCREILYGPSVYLGDITQFYMDDQPYWFTVKHMPYEKAKGLWGKFDNFEYVQPGNYNSKFDGDDTMYQNNYRLTDVKEGQVEVIVYQDQPNDEFNVIINGVPMFPIGFPLSAVTPDGKYNVAKQVLRVNNPHFAYGQSFVSSGSIKQVSKLIDEILRLFMLKERKSFAAPRGNISGRNVSPNALLPGRLTMGLDPGDIPKLDEEGDGVTQGEVAVLQQFSQLINDSTVSPMFGGNSPKGTQTATESVELQRQSRMTLGLMILAVTLLEKKLGYLRLYNILEHWFDPTGKTWYEDVDGTMKEKNTYRSVNRQDADIQGEGVGERQISLMEELPSPDAIRGLEREESEKKGHPVRRLALNPNAIKKSKFHFYIETNPEEKESSPFHKLMFREQLNDILAMAQLGSQPNVSGLEERVSRVWGEPRSRLFETGDGEMSELKQMMGEADGKINTPEQIGQSMGQGGSSLDSPGKVPAGASGGLLGG